MVEIEFENFVPSIPIDESEYCGQASFKYAAAAISVDVPESQEELRMFVSDKSWGTQPNEQENMALTYLPESHFLAKTHWQMADLEEILESPDTVAVINIHDNFARIAEDGELSDAPPDGHYINVWTFVEIDSIKYAVIIDSSTEKMMETHPDVLHTKYDSVYLITTKLLESLWHDKLKNGDENFHWAMVLVSPKAEASILNKFRK
jgi:hypothetical protein